MNNYYNKYLKYKAKYSELKDKISQMKGGQLSNLKNMLVMGAGPIGLLNTLALLTRYPYNKSKKDINSTDAVVLCLPANEDIGAGDEYIAKQIKGRQEVFLVVTKVDTVSKSELAAKLVLVTEFAQKVGQEKAEIIPISAKNLEQTDLLLNLLAKKLPASPALYPTDINTDQVQELMFADLIREAAIEELYEELPHSVMVTIEEMGERDNGKIFDISATLHVERDSQKGIIIGPQGSKLKAIGSIARKSIENIVGLQVFLQIHVKVSKEWQKDPKLLSKLGFIDSLSD